MKATKKSVSIGALVLLCLAWMVFYSLSLMSLEVPSANIPPPVVVQLAQSPGPLRVFPGIAGVLMILPDGSLWRWGETGPGDWARATVPIQVGTNLNWKQASATDGHSVAVRTDGTLWEWGWRGGSVFCDDPTQVDPGHDWIEASAGDTYSIARKSNGTLWTWTLPLGSGGIGPAQTNLVQIGTNNDWTAIIAQSSHALGLGKDGTLRLWGMVDWFPQTKGSAIFILPIQVSRDTNWIGLDRHGALLRNQTVELWNPLISPPDADAAVSSNGFLMASNWIPKRSATGWVGGQTHYEIRADGTLWKTPFRFTPRVPKSSIKWRQVGKRSDWISIWGDGAVVGLTSDGTLWMWGYDYGQESIPDLRSRFTMFQVRILTWLRRPPKFSSGQGNLQYQKEPRPLMRLVPAHNLSSDSATVPAR